MLHNLLNGVIILSLLKGIVRSESYDPKFGFMMHPTIDSDYVNTSIALTCSGYYMSEDQGLTTAVDISWYFERELSERETPANLSPVLITSNTRSPSGKLMFELSEPSNATLEFKTSSVEYNGEYYCVIEKFGLSKESERAHYQYGGTDSHVFKVEPTINPEVPPMSGLQLSCETNPSFGDSPVIQWFYNPSNETHYNIGNMEYAPFNLDLFFIYGMGDTMSVLTFTFASKDYDGEYYCKAWYNDEEQYDSKPTRYKYAVDADLPNSYPFAVSIQVLESGVKKELANNVYVDQGKLDTEVSFICKFESFSTMYGAEFKWIFTPPSSLFVELTDDHKLYKIDLMSGEEPMSRLRMKYSSSQYNGEYRCVVSGYMADEYTYSVSDKYMYIYNGEKVAPEFLSQPSFRSGASEFDTTRDLTPPSLITESGVTLHCNVTQPKFYPPVQITWYRGSTSSGPRVPLPTKEMNVKYELSADNSTLTFLTYSWYYNGTYHCEATNSEATVVSSDALYQYGGYISITERLNADQTHSMVCDYSVANTNAETSQVTWYYLDSLGEWEPVDTTNIVIENNEEQSISTLTFQSMSLEDVRLYKCLFVKRFNERDKWAYGFHKPSVCTLQSTPSPSSPGSSVTVSRGDEISLTCSCAVSLSGNATFLFFKDRKGDTDMDIGEKYLGTDNFYRLQIENLEENKGAELTIPFARQQDRGRYECGYQIEGEQQRIFVENGVTIDFQGVLPKSEGSPFGFGSYDLSNGIWQNVEVMFNGERLIAEAKDVDIVALLFILPSYPSFLDFDYEFVLHEIPDVFNKPPFVADFFGVDTLFFDSRKDVLPGDPTVYFFHYNKPGINVESPMVTEETIALYRENKANLKGRYSINYTVNYALPEGSVLPPYFPTELSVDIVFPEYSSDTLVAPESRYIVLVASEEWSDHLAPVYLPHLRCNFCQTKSGVPSECPVPHNIVPSWSVEGNAPVEEALMEYLKPSSMEKSPYSGQLGVGDLMIQKIDMLLGRTYVCTFHYTLPKQKQARQASAKSDIIVEDTIPLKHDPQLSTQDYSPDSTVSLPLRRAVGKPFDLIVYLDISMAQSLYEDLVTVKWGKLRDGESSENVDWLPNDYRQENNWQTKRLSYLVEEFTGNTTYVCHVSYLQRVMTLQTPVVVLEIPPPVTNLTGSLDEEQDSISFTWEPSPNVQDNYFIEYKVLVRRKSASPYSKEREEVIPIPSSRVPTVTLQVAPYCLYTVEVVAVYEDGESEISAFSVESEEEKPSPPSSVVVDTNTQQLSDDDLVFIFWLRIDPPSVALGEIIGYKLELLARPEEEEDNNMTEDRRRRSVGNGERGVWTQYISDEDEGFHPNGTFTGEVEFNITSGMEDINAIRVSARTTAGYGEPYETGFLTFEQLFVKESSTWVYIVVTLVIIFILGLGVAVVCYLKRHQQVKKIIKTQYNPLYPIMRSVVPDQWEVNPDDLKLSTALGEGAFGRVMKGALLKEGKTIQVAVKMLKEEASSETEAEALWKEIILMKKVGSHPHIVNIMGCVSVKTPICLLVEYVPNGDLQSFLRSHRIKFEKEHMLNMRKITSNIAKSATKSKLNGGTSTQDADPLGGATGAGYGGNGNVSSNSEYINLKSPEASYVNLQGVDNEEKAGILTSNHMLNMMYQIACGMKYLAFKNIIHRDLAARNILVGEDLTVKVSDFGLARDMYLEGQYMMNPRGRVPFKWMSPEALFDLKFTSKSDVWSYGVLLWEIVTLGGSPYPGIEPAKLYKLLKKGYRMARPDGCSIEIYDVMKDCWQEDPDLRPPFDDLAHTIQQLMSLDSVDYLTVGQGIASIVDDEEAGAVEILSDDVPVQSAEQYSNVTRTKLSSSSSSSSESVRSQDNPNFPLLDETRRQNSVPPVLRRLETLDFPPRSPTTAAVSASDGVRPESNYSASNFISESVL